MTEENVYGDLQNVDLGDEILKVRMKYKNLGAF